MVAFNRFLMFFTSLRLTVACLVFALGLVFIGTLAQVKWGLYQVQQEYFRSAFVWWQPNGMSWKLPVWPGGYLLGWVLLINLIAAHIKRFELSSKKFGIFLTHAGLILLLLGQFLTEVYQVESYMALPEGSSKNYSESSRNFELAIVDVTDPKENKVISIPEAALAHQKVIEDSGMPFKVAVQNYGVNSELKLAPPSAPGGPNQLLYLKTNAVTAMDERNFPMATVQIETDEGTKGPFTVSTWTGEERLIGSIARQWGNQLPGDFYRPSSFTHKGRTYEVTMRPVRYYKPHTIQLIDFTHERYPGTQIPKNFSSRVKVINPGTQENREVLIYMNNPLRYGGETYYQGGFEPGDTVSILQVVRNPSWLTPYVACSLVGLGLIVQFMMHLLGFVKKKRSA